MNPLVGSLRLRHSGVGFDATRFLSLDDAHAGLQLLDSGRRVVENAGGEQLWSTDGARDYAESRSKPRSSRYKVGWFITDWIQHRSRPAPSHLQTTLSIIQAPWPHQPFRSGGEILDCNKVRLHAFLYPNHEIEYHELVEQKNKVRPSLAQPLNPRARLP